MYLIFIFLFSSFLNLDGMFKCSCFQVQNQIIPMTEQSIRQLNSVSPNSTQSTKINYSLIEKQSHQILMQYESFNSCKSFPPVKEIIISDQDKDYISSISSMSHYSCENSVNLSVNLSVNTHNFASLEIKIKEAIQEKLNLQNKDSYK